jgi:carbonic anhydrase/acetyltransferase-like protein (isoleucine patch superfamily)
VPLSEEELRALEQMERALVQEDPKLASTLRGTSLRRAAQRRAVLGGVCFVGGLAVLMAGAIGRITLVGVLGFVIMLASATVGLAAIRGRSSAHAPVIHTGHQPGSMLDRFGTPWRRRHDDQA